MVNVAVFTSFVHCLKLRCRNPRVRFAFPATSEICLYHVRSSDTLTPRYLLASVTSRTWLWSVYEDWKALFFLFYPEVMRMMVHFDGLKLICNAPSNPPVLRGLAEVDCFLWLHSQSSREGCRQRRVWPPRISVSLVGR